MNVFSARIRFALFVCLSVLLFYAISPTRYLQRGIYLLVTAKSALTSTVSPISRPTMTMVSDVPKAPAGTTRFAVIGDYGLVWSSVLADLAEVVKSWQPDFVATLGDNNYPLGAETTIDLNIGQFYQEFIYPYRGEFGPGAESNRFWPALGNHDWESLSCTGGRCRGPYFDYFTLPNNERYYDFVQGPVHFFVVDSDSHEPDGITAGSIQGRWLQEGLAASTAQWKLVYMHHPPYSSGRHGSQIYLQWPYHEWGADVVLAGHDHMYERISQDDMVYFVNGAGGANLYQFQTPIAGSEVRYNENHGAMLVDANDDMITFQFINLSGEVIDSYTIEASQPPTSSESAMGRLTWPVMADAYVQESSPTVNYGDESLLQSGLEPHNITYLKFDLSDLADLDVVSAKLRMWVANNRQAGTRSQPEIKLVKESNWHEMSLTYNNRPALESVISHIYATRAGDRIEIDLSESVSKTIGSTLSIAIDATSSNDLQLHSRESIMGAPELIIDYNGNGPTPAVADVFPRQGVTDVHNEINIYGQHFQPQSTIRMNNEGLRTGASIESMIPLTSSFISANQLRAIIPANQPAGRYKLEVSNPDGNHTTYADAYTLLGAKDHDLSAFDYELLTKPQTLRIGQEAQLSLLVHRQGGTKTLTNVNINFYKRNQVGLDTLIGSTIISDLAPNSIKSTTPITWTPTGLGQTVIYAHIDPAHQISESIQDNNIASRSVTVLRQSNKQSTPTIGHFTIDGGLTDTFDRTVELSTQPAKLKDLGEIESLFVTEFEYHQGSRQWHPAQQSGWQPYTTTQPTLYWKVQPTEGIKYLQLWVADKNDNISAPKGAWISYLPSNAHLSTDLSHFYAYTLGVSDTMTATISATNGDPDLYIWSPSEGVSWHSINESGETEQIIFTAPQEGTYIMQVYAYEATEYHLDVTINPTESDEIEDQSAATSFASGTPLLQINTNTNANKIPLEQPGLAPHDLPQTLPYALPAKRTLRQIYLPLLLR